MKNLISAANIKAHIDFLADDLLEGRETGSRGFDIASRYVASQFGADILEATLLTVCGILLGLALLYAGLALSASHVQAHYGLHIAFAFPGARELARAQPHCFFHCI